MGQAITVDQLPNNGSVRTAETQRAEMAVHGMLRTALHLENRTAPAMSRDVDPDYPILEGVVNETVVIGCTAPGLGLKCTPVRHPRPERPDNIPPDGPIFDAWQASQQSHIHNGLVMFNTPGVYVINAAICGGMWNRQLVFAVFPQRAVNTFMGWPDDAQFRHRARATLRKCIEHSKHGIPTVESCIAALETHLVADGLSGVTNRLLGRDDGNALAVKNLGAG